MNRLRHKENKEYTLKQKLFIISCLVMLFGIIIGAVIANRMEQIQSNEVGKYVGEFIDTVKNEGGFYSTNINDSFFKYAKYLLLVWVCGFIAPGGIIIMIILALKGVSYGFTTAFLVKNYGSTGITLAISSYLPQNIIIIPIYIIVSGFALEYIINRFKRKTPKAGLRREKQKDIMEYLIVLAVSMLLLLFSSIVEIYVVPILLKIFIN